MECLIDTKQLEEEVEFLRKNLKLQKHYAELLNDLDKSISMLGTTFTELMFSFM